MKGEWVSDFYVFVCMVAVCLVARRTTQPGTEALYMAGKTIAGDVRDSCLTLIMMFMRVCFSRLPSHAQNKYAYWCDLFLICSCCRLEGFPFGDASVLSWSAHCKSLQGSLTGFQHPHRYPGAAQGVPGARHCCSSCGTAQACYGGSSCRTLLMRSYSAACDVINPNQLLGMLV
jgi:hypothetical protein